MQEAMQVQENR